MLFCSINFIFIFLPILLLVHFLSPKRFRNFVLLIASIIFYAWGEAKYLPVLFSVIAITYLGGILLDKFPHKKELIFPAIIISDLSFLFYFKYFNFFIDTINSISHANMSTFDIVLPLGISFYTFQALSYIFDIYNNKTKTEYNFLKLCLYICLFPQLIAGPIIKYKDINEQIDAREIDFEKVNTGVKRFVIGLSKKILIANYCGEIADKIFAQNPADFSPLISWLGAVAYTFQIYFDFSGYSDMAIGLGLIFGFKFLENFNYPYISKSITEFWRRWHISLSTWFKEYVYIPIGGNKCSQIKHIRNLFTVFLLTGIWHGANFTFIIWGLWHGTFIVFEKLSKLKELDNKKIPWYFNVPRHIYCLIVICIGWVIFRSENMYYAVDYILNMFGLLSHNSLKHINYFEYYCGEMSFYLFVAAILFSTPIFSKIKSSKNIILKYLLNLILWILFLFSVATIATTEYNPFIYFRF